MNILMVNWSWYPTGGDWTAVENLTNLYQMKGHNVIPFSMKHENNIQTPYEIYFINKIDYRALHSNKTLFTGIKVLHRSIYSKESRTKLNELLNSIKIDIAHIHNIGPQITPSILPLLKQKKIPIIWTLHDYSLLCPATSFYSRGKVCEECKVDKFYKCLINKCKKNSVLASLVTSIRSYILKFWDIRKYVDVFICPSKFIFSKFIEYGFKREQLVQIYNMFDKRKILQIDNSVSISFLKSDYIIYVGRIERIKGIMTLLKTIKHIKDLNLLIVGLGEDDYLFKKYVEENMINNIYFLGHLDKKNVITLLRNSLFLVCPSEWYENLPYAIVEGMLLSKPIIGSRIGGIPELVIDGYTGYTFEVGNVQEFREKILILKNNPLLREKMGTNGYNYVQQLVDPETHYYAMENIFKKLIPY